MICGKSQLTKTHTQRNQCKTKFTGFLVFNKGLCIKPHRGKSPFAFFPSGWIPGWLLSRFHSDESLKGKDVRSFPLDCNLFFIVEMRLAPIPLNAAGKPPEVSVLRDTCHMIVCHTSPQGRIRQVKPPLFTRFF